MPLCACMLGNLSHDQLFVILWTLTFQAPLSMGFFRQEYWSGLPCPSPGDLPDPGTEPPPLMSPLLAGRFFTISTTWEAQVSHTDTKLKKEKFVFLVMRSQDFFS